MELLSQRQSNFDITQAQWNPTDTPKVVMWQEKEPSCMLFVIQVSSKLSKTFSLNWGQAYLVDSVPKLFIYLEYLDVLSISVLSVLIL